MNRRPTIRLKRRIIGPLSLLLVSIIVIALMNFYFYKAEDWQKAHQQTVSSLQVHLNDVTEQNLTVMRTALQMVEHNQEVIQAFVERDRERLNTISQPLYQILNQDHQISHFYFTAADRINFLRVHQPDRYGDRIERPSTLQAEQQRASAWGLEVGPLGTYTLRMVKPIFNLEKPDQLLGYLEMGMEIEHVLSFIAKDLEVEFILLLNKSRVNKQQWKQGMKRLNRAADWNLFPQMVLIYSTQPELSKVQYAVARSVQTRNGEGYQLLKSGEQQVNVIYSSVDSLINRSGGHLIGFKDVSAEVAQVNHEMWMFIIYAAILSLLYLIMLYLFLNKSELWFAAQQMESEKSLNEREARLLEAQELGQIGHWERRLDNQQLIGSNQIYSIFEVDSTRFDASYEGFLEVIHPEDRQRVNEVFNESITSQQPYQVVYRLLMADGRIKWVDERGQTTYSTSGTPLISRGTVQDITQQKESEQEIIQANRAKDDFLASMSHELRTPLTSIIGNSELLAEAEVDLDKKKVIRAIEVAGRSQLALVNDVLDMSKIESGKFSIQEVPFDLATLIYDIEHMFELRARDAGLELAVELRSQEPYRLMGDGQRIGQVLINLIGNAIKFTNEGKVTLSIWSDQRYLNFVVEDTGVGISPEKMDSLFQRFEQADNSISRRFGGTGLGLFISETLSTLMGGIIDASSIEGKGSRFVLSLPYRQSTILVQLEQQIEQRNSVLSGGFEGRGLGAEDTPELQLLERRILESMGVKVEVANNGVEAVQMVTEHPFDLVLMDMQMPLMDGVEATRQIRAHNNQVPIVALTANVMEGHRVAFEEAGSNSFLSKPIDRQELRQVLAEFLPELDEILASDRRAAERRVVSRRVEERRSTL